MHNRKSYKELSRLKTYEERLEYLRESGVIGDRTFGGNRYLNQRLYTSPEWRRVRDQVIVRDGGCDLGIEGEDVYEGILVHHINPLTEEDVKNSADCIFDLDNLICCSRKTHNAIHYGTEDPKSSSFLQERKPNDTCPWRKVNNQV